MPAVAIDKLKAGDIIELQEGRGRVTDVTTRSHMPPIFQDAFGSDGRSIHWINLDGEHKGKRGVERAHKDTTLNLIEGRA